MENCKTVMNIMFYVSLNFLISILALKLYGISCFSLLKPQRKKGFSLFNGSSIRNPCLEVLSTPWVPVEGCDYLITWIISWIFLLRRLHLLEGKKLFISSNMVQRIGL